MMDSFGAGLVMGVVAVAVAVAFFATDGFDLLEPVLGERVAGLVQGEIAVGTFEMRTDDHLYFGVLVYAPYGESMAALVDDVRRYQPVPLDQTPAEVREAVCAQAACEFRAPEQRLLADLQDAFGSVVAGSVGFTGNGSAQYRWDGDKLLFVALARGARDAQPALLEAAPRLEEIRTGLVHACENATGGLDACQRRYVPFHVNGTWDTGWQAHHEGVEPNRTVLGPLTWETTRLASGGTPAYVPNLALLLSALIVLAAILVQEGLELAGKNPFVPLPPLAVLASLAGIAFVASTRGEMGVARVYLFLAVLLFGGWLAVYRFLDFAGVQHFSLLTALVALAAGAAVLLVGLADALGDPEEVLLGTFNEGSSGLVKQLGVRTLAASGAASVGALVVTVSVSLTAYVQGLRRVPASALRRALNEEKGGVWTTLAAVDPARGDGLSRSAYASVVARFYGSARRAQGIEWVKDALWRPSAMRVALRGLDAVPAHLATGARDETPLAALWRLHAESARRARNRPRLLKG